MKKLTIGSAVYDDFDGIFFSYQSIRLNNQDILDDLDLIVVDNNPESAEGKATLKFCLDARINYIPITSNKSTGLRNHVFKNSKASHTLCMDPHVLFEPNTIKNLINFYEQNPESGDLHQGPLLMDIIKGHDPMTHMDPVWRSQMWGTWGINPKGANAEGEPFDVPMQGLGVFSCKTDQWLPFNENFIGFGGEEGYIHEKFRQNKRRTLCLPFLRWIHRFGRPRGVPYPLRTEDRIHNYIVGFQELGLDLSPVINHFNQEVANFSAKDFIKNIVSYREEFLKRNAK